MDRDLPEAFGSPGWRSLPPPRNPGPVPWGMAPQGDGCPFLPLPLLLPAARDHSPPRFSSPACCHRRRRRAHFRTTVVVTSLTRAGRRPMESGSNTWAEPGRAHIATPTSPGRRDVRSAAPWHFRGSCRPVSPRRTAGPSSACFNYIAPHLFACPEVVRSPPALHTCVTLDK